MSLITSLVRLFETTDQKRARIVEELGKLRAQVDPKKKSASIRYDAGSSDQEAWLRIGKLEKQLTKLDAKTAKSAPAKT